MPIALLWLSTADCVMPSKNDNEYYLRRLKRDYRSIYDDLKAGRIKSVRQARIIAGIFPTPTDGVALERAWKKTGLSGRVRFVDRHMREVADTIKAWKAAALPRALPPIVDAEGRLTAQAKKRITDLKKSLNLRTGELSAELGFSPLDVSISGALYGQRLKSKDVIAALQTWVEKNKGIR